MHLTPKSGPLVNQNKQDGRTGKDSGHRQALDPEAGLRQNRASAAGAQDQCGQLRMCPRERGFQPPSARPSPSCSGRRLTSAPVLPGGGLLVPLGPHLTGQGLLIVTVTIHGQLH